jgi:uncharacterized protein YjiS (DUF1127 family)
MSTSSFAHHASSRQSGFVAPAICDRRPARQEVTVKELISIGVFCAGIAFDGALDHVHRAVVALNRGHRERRTLEILREMDPHRLQDIGLRPDDLTAKRLHWLLIRRQLFD